MVAHVQKREGELGRSAERAVDPLQTSNGGAGHVWEVMTVLLHKEVGGTGRNWYTTTPPLQHTRRFV